MANNLRQVLDSLKVQLAYRNIDKAALNLSRSNAAGNLGVGRKGADPDYMQWAQMTDDPMVVVNYVKTFVSQMESKFTMHPIRPVDETFANDMAGTGINLMFNEEFLNVLNDGIGYVGVGMRNGVPQFRDIDARYILFNGEDPTLKDSTDVVVFEIVPLTHDEIEDGTYRLEDYPSDCVDYDPNTQKVITSHYSKRERKGEDGTRVVTITLDVYRNMDDKPEHYEMKGVDRIPVVRFVGDKVELSDRKWHYRGVYYTAGSVAKAMTLSATKVQVNVANDPTDNYICGAEGLSGNPEWAHKGALPFTQINPSTGETMPLPKQVVHDNQFILESFKLWKTVLYEILGPVVQSTGEALNAEEIRARNEAKDALACIYISRFITSAMEVYRCVKMLRDMDPNPVPVVGGYLLKVQNEKHLATLDLLFNRAKESGLNTQGFLAEYLKYSSLPPDSVKNIQEKMFTDPFASTQVAGLKTQVQQLTQALHDLQQKYAIMRTLAANRLERQREFVQSNENIQLNKMRMDAWKQESQEVQQGRMEILKGLVQNGMFDEAIAMLDTMRQPNPSPGLQQQTQFDAEGDSVTEQLHEADMTPFESVQQQLNQEAYDAKMGNSDNQGINMADVKPTSGF